MEEEKQEQSGDIVLDVHDSFITAEEFWGIIDQGVQDMVNKNEEGGKE